MKAYQLMAINDLQYNDVKIPEIKLGWCMIKVKAAGICSSDIPRIFSKGAYHFPIIPGHEFSGVVEKVGNIDDQKWVGKHVSVFPLIPCKKCVPCLEHHYEMCEHYDYIGSRCDGAFAEYVAVPVWNLVELPENIGFETAAILEPLSVALHAVKRAGIKKGDSVGIVGTGMIGFAVAQWAKFFGASCVQILGRNEKKRKIAEKVDVELVNIEKQPGNQFNIVIEAAGTVSSIQKSIMLAKPGGRIVWMGNPEGDITFLQDIYWRVLRKQITITGTWNSTYESGLPCDWLDVIDAVVKRKVEAAPLISHMFTQENLMDGLKLMLEHKEAYCKIITLWNS